MLCDDLNYGYRGSVKDKIQVLSKTAQGKKVTRIAEGI